MIREQAAQRWFQQMAEGNFEAAWRESDLIESTHYPDPNRFWKGESWSGKRVMLRCLHGLGDTIQFIRYAPLLRRTCAHLTVQTHPELVTLVRTVEGVDKAGTWGESEDWDIQMEVTELPRAFRTSVDTIPAEIPYVKVQRENRASGRMQVGLIWQSSQWNPARSIPFELLRPLVEGSHCDFHFLQKDAETDRRSVLDTAHRMIQLDLVISVDTMSAHLAGALGRPVWILLPEFSDWRWMKYTTRSPWYPTAELFRQQEQGNWGGVIETICERLKRRLQEHESEVTEGSID